eukprot:TRINITY_DN761_c0_g1_i1.p1 TRINITY_DN761_c0_g1~~TRINITY_DN761_c0_g1_i1.p1  ORF type:complete len:359 (-),score=72.52 TRINITY_DN761_c0_g1_i1:138-1214(-)
MVGFGVNTFPDGRRYEGNWKDGVFVPLLQKKDDQDIDHIAVRCSAAAYRSDPSISLLKDFEGLQIVFHKREYFVATLEQKSSRLNVICFTGTQMNGDDLWTDAKCSQVFGQGQQTLIVDGRPTMCSYHQGFYERAESLVSDASLWVPKLLTNGNRWEQVLVCGHSLGGSSAILFTIYFLLRKCESIERVDPHYEIIEGDVSCVTFGAAMVGTAELTGFILENQSVFRTYARLCDPVPGLPRFVGEMVKRDDVFGAVVKTLSSSYWIDFLTAPLRRWVPSVSLTKTSVTPGATRFMWEENGMIMVKEIFSIFDANREAGCDLLSLETTALGVLGWHSIQQYVSDIEMLLKQKGSHTLVH